MSLSTLNIIPGEQQTWNNPNKLHLYIAKGIHEAELIGKIGTTPLCVYA